MRAVTFSSIEASIISTVVTQPFWVIKTRMLLNITPGIGEVENAILKCKEIYSQSGLRGFTKGLSISLLLSFSGVLQMYVYEWSKNVYDSLNLPQTNGLNEKNFICGSLSKFAAIIITYPFTTIRTRIQQNQYFNNRTEAKYQSISDVAYKIAKEEGLRGFYKGIIPNLMKGIPQRGIYFYFYEMFKRLFIT